MKSSIRLIMILALLMIVHTVANAQSCNALPPSGQFQAYAQNSTIEVNIDPNFSDPVMNAIEEAFTNWIGANGSSGNCSGVVFHFHRPYTKNPIIGPRTFQVNSVINLRPTINGDVCANTIKFPQNN